MFEKSMVRFCLLQIQGPQLAQDVVEGAACEKIGQGRLHLMKITNILVCPPTRGLLVVTIQVQATKKAGKLGAGDSGIGQSCPNPTCGRLSFPQLLV
jgi:hypothetical protein